MGGDRLKGLWDLIQGRSQSGPVIVCPVQPGGGGVLSLFTNSSSGGGGGGGCCCQKEIDPSDPPWLRVSAGKGVPHDGPNTRV